MSPTDESGIHYAALLPMPRCGPAPLYYQLAGSLEAAVASGIIKHGTKLPTEREMARELKLAPATIRMAWAYLENKGMITRHRRTGTIVL